jgi:DNA primase
MPESLELAEEYDRNLPERIRTYLRGARGITDAVIDRFLLGWNGSRITIPIFDSRGEFAFFKLAKDPEDRTDSPKMLATAGAHAELYGWERVLAKPEDIIICEGEFDRLVLESHGLAAVTSTGGALTFRAEWADSLREIPRVYICFDSDLAGRVGAERVARLIPHARVLSWPEEIGEGGDVTDFFVHLGRRREDFLSLLEAAQPLPPARPQPPLVRPSPRDRSQIEQLKSRIPIQDLVSRYVPLRPSGANFTGCCPFHDDRKPSFVVYPRTQSFYCFACQAHGDTFTFLMKKDQLTFPQAVETLKQLAS